MSDVLSVQCLDTTDVVAVDTTNVLAVDATDVLSADATDVMSAHNTWQEAPLTTHHPTITTSQPFNFVYSLEWKNFISNIFPDIPITNNIMAEIQHHHVGSKDGWIHNDYDASHFVNDPVNNGINPWYYQCPYRQEEPNENLITNVRSIAIIYYLNEIIYFLI